MTSQFTSNLNPDEIKDLISQLSAENVTDLKTGLEHWLDTPDSSAREGVGLSASPEPYELEERHSL
ncbi:MAG: hypothetical protein R6U67_15740 [Sodalinema sp.]|uniref:hypothetical protein n=1 Tax=Sodalinema sp. TaxID=3080550 RepID=UPI0012044549|nr:MAG: hypothetical protein EYR95_04895 [Phormidium sp. SL48-SHIP]